MDDCLFCKIIKGDIPSAKVFENDDVFAFRDINPQAPVHILIVPKKHVANVLEGADAGEAASRMAAFLAGCGAKNILLIAPPPMKRGAWVPDDHLVAVSAELARQYRLLAERMGLYFADAGEWGVDLAFDGVHFTPEGHAAFARGLEKRLGELL